jgi:hypothetical protein
MPDASVKAVHQPASPLELLPPASEEEAVLYAGEQIGYVHSFVEDPARDYDPMVLEQSVALS